MANDQKKPDEAKALTPDEIAALKAKAAELDALKPALEGFKFRADGRDVPVNLLTEEGRKLVATKAAAGEHITERGKKFNDEKREAIEKAVADKLAEWTKAHPQATPAEAKKAEAAIEAKAKGLSERLDLKALAAKFEDSPEAAIAELVAAVDATLSDAVASRKPAEAPEVKLPEGIVTEQRLAELLATRDRQVEIANDPRMVAYLGAAVKLYEQVGNSPKRAREAAVRDLEAELQERIAAASPDQEVDLFADVIEPRLAKLNPDWNKKPSDPGKLPDGEEKKPDSEPETKAMTDEEFKEWLRQREAEKKAGSDPRTSY